MNNRVRPFPSPRAWWPTLTPTQLLADGFAANGFKTVIPDIMNGDPMTDAARADPTWDKQKWFAAHGPESWTGVVDAVVGALTAQGVARIGTVGFCFGAPPAFYLAFKNAAHVTVVTHPSRLAVPGDFEVRHKLFALCGRRSREM